MENFLPLLIWYSVEGIKRITRRAGGRGRDVFTCNTATCHASCCHFVTFCDVCSVTYRDQEHGITYNIVITRIMNIKHVVIFSEYARSAPACRVSHSKSQLLFLVVNSLSRQLMNNIMLSLLFWKIYLDKLLVFL